MTEEKHKQKCKEDGETIGRRADSRAGRRLTVLNTKPLMTGYTVEIDRKVGMKQPWRG